MVAIVRERSWRRVDGVGGGRPALAYQRDGGPGHCTAFGGRGVAGPGAQARGRVRRDGKMCSQATGAIACVRRFGHVNPVASDLDMSYAAWDVFLAGMNNKIL